MTATGGLSAADLHGPDRPARRSLKKCKKKSAKARKKCKAKAKKLPV